MAEQAQTKDLEQNKPTPKKQNTLAKRILLFRLIAFSFGWGWDALKRTWGAKLHKRRAISKNAFLEEPKEPKNVVVVGASFSGYHAARLLASALPIGSAYRLIVIEPNSHFQFTWVFPRFCVVSGHEHKAFIPYGPYLNTSPDGATRWVQDRVTSIEKTHVVLQDGDDIPYEFLVIATGSGADLPLPSRVGSTDKAEGVKFLRKKQAEVRDAKRIVVVGGGAAGTELAMDAKAKFPEKEITLVHSRNAVMNRFGPELQQTALDWLENLGCKVILNERTASEETVDGVTTVTLKSGTVLQCDLVINCTGQKPNSGLLRSLAPKAISDDGHIKVKPTLQVDDDSFSNIYACGDIAHSGSWNPNSRIAMRQACIVADNIYLAMRGKQPTHHYVPNWAEFVIKLTLGIDDSVLHFGDGKTELLFYGKETDEALMCDGAWSNMGATPFEDDKYKSEETVSVIETTAQPTT